jgi:hypothetical protein
LRRWMIRAAAPVPACRPQPGRPSPHPVSGPR